MSALENPASMVSAWHDPWNPASNGGSVLPPMHHVHNMDFYAHTSLHQATPPPLIHKDSLSGSNPSSLMNTSSDSSNASTSGGSAGTGSSCQQTNKNNNVRSGTKGRVNFKLEIKHEPEDGSAVNGMQKVPSISDLSDQESSIDMPQQVMILDIISMKNIELASWEMILFVFKKSSGIHLMPLFLLWILHEWAVGERKWERTWPTGKRDERYWMFNTSESNYILAHPKKCQQSAVHWHLFRG